MAGVWVEVQSMPSRSNLYTQERTSAVAIRDDDSREILRRKALSRT